MGQWLCLAPAVEASVYPITQSPRRFHRLRGLRVGVLSLHRCDRTPDRDQPTLRPQFHGPSRRASPRCAPLNVWPVREAFVVDRPVTVPVATPDQAMPSGTGAQHVPEVWADVPFIPHTDDVHGQAIAMPCIVGALAVRDHPTAIVVGAAKPVQERLSLVRPHRLKDLRGVAPCFHVCNHPLHGFTEERGQHRQVRLHRHFSRGEGEFMIGHLSSSDCWDHKHQVQRLLQLLR